MDRLKIRFSFDDNGKYYANHQKLNYRVAKVVYVG